MAINMEVHDDDVIFVFVLRHLMARNFTETAHCLERESGAYFHIQYFEELIMTSRYDEAEDYVLGFTYIQENRYSAKLIFDIKKLKLMEALHTGARCYAKNIVEHEFPQFRAYNNKIYDEAMEMVCMENYRSHESMRRYEQAGTRRLVVEEMKKYIRANPVFHGKLDLPSLQSMVRRVLATNNNENGTMAGFFQLLRDYLNRNGGNI